MFAARSAERFAEGGREMKDRFQMGRSQVGWMLFLGIVVAGGLALFLSLSVFGRSDHEAAVVLFGK